jgi:NAD(P)-dependent dehydrogenase (short-subunit alcohol dehydrogenase family)
VNVLIVGANGGIGAALAQLALADERMTRLFASSRRIDELPRHPKLEPLQLDFLSATSIDQAGETLSAQVQHLDLVIVAAGFLHDGAGGPEKSLRELNGDQMQKVLQINAVGPLLLFARLESLLKQAQAPKILFLSAQVGSIEDNRLGGWYSYRMSKAALNQGVRTAAIEAGRWRNGATLVAVHPGTTETPLSQPFIKRRQAAVQSATACAEHLWELADQLDAKDNGSFLRTDGTSLPW